MATVMGLFVASEMDVISAVTARYPVSPAAGQARRASTPWDR
jgi:hypothetical protein